MRFNTRQKIWLTLVIAVNATLWLIPGDVVANIARDQQTMLGRYSRTHFAWILGVLAISLVSLYIDWSSGATYKRRWFQVLATLFFLLPCVAVVDAFIRTADTMHYIREDGLYHRPPNTEFRQVFVDAPQAKRTYPNLKPGFGTIECIARTDERGYRNAATADQYDIVALGDSFTEGSGVSDADPWPAHLAKVSQRTVCNLGMSGYDPFHYLESLRRVGISLKPSLVICVLYEGNDFRSSASDEKRRSPSLSKKFSEYVDRSPLIKAIDNSITNSFGSIGADRPLPNADLIAWLPLTVPDSPHGRNYAFEPKQLRDLLQTQDAFENDKHWHNPRGQIGEMNELCKKAGAQFVLVLAPTKARVVLPLVANRLNASHVRSFAAIDYKKPLPPEGEFLAELLTRADAKEQTLASWCASESIPFFSPAVALRSAIAEGNQVYYTYDQHWSPTGHDVFAHALFTFITEKKVSASDALTDTGEH